ncbi:hypothetical protein MAR_013030 [Mya arenaria]|uniref:Uncharacterized protein n=1 Tax=Mya arenaria TaxID=6604 RepID=A0ABY7G7T7_MYAAR|nr:hypothetical protein MAR_013030 [Mya arenaria]
MSKTCCINTHGRFANQPAIVSCLADHLKASPLRKENKNQGGKNVVTIRQFQRHNKSSTLRPSMCRRNAIYLWRRKQLRWIGMRENVSDKSH